MGLKNFFVCALNLSNDNILLPKGLVWKRLWILEVWSENGCGNYTFWPEIGSGFGEPGGTPPTRIPRSTFPGNRWHQSLKSTTTTSLFSITIFVQVLPIKIRCDFSKRPLNPLRSLSGRFREVRLFKEFENLKIQEKWCMPFKTYCNFQWGFAHL